MFYIAQFCVYFPMWPFYIWFSIDCTQTWRVCSSIQYTVKYAYYCILCITTIIWSNSQLEVFQAYYVVLTCDDCLNVRYWPIWENTRVFVRLEFLNFSSAILPCCSHWTQPIQAGNEPKEINDWEQKLNMHIMWIICICIIHW